MNYDEKVMTLIDTAEGIWNFVHDAVARLRNEEDLLLTKEEVAELMNCSTRTVARLQEEREIEYVVLRGCVRFTKQAVRDAIRRNTIKVSPKTKREFEANFKAIVAKRVK